MDLIFLIEQVLGGLDVFLPYVKDYVETFMGKSITTAQWKEHLYAYWAKRGQDKIQALDSVKWDAWLYGEGTELPVKIEYDLTLAEVAYKLAERWDKAREKELADLDFKETDLQNLSSNQIGMALVFHSLLSHSCHLTSHAVVFLERLQSYYALPSNLVLHLGNLYRLSTSPNAEIRLRFYEVVFSDPSTAAARQLVSDAVKWVTGHDGSGMVKGRMKFCRPVLRACAKVDKDLVLESWEKEKYSFHPIARKLIDKVGFVFHLN